MQVDINELREVSLDDEVESNVNRIRQFLDGDSPYLSTSQQIMVGLALCRPDLLEAAQYPAREIVLAWKRLDAAQLEAVTIWWQS